MNRMLMSGMEPDVLFARLLSLHGVTHGVGLQIPSNTKLKWHDHGLLLVHVCI